MIPRVTSCCLVLALLVAVGCSDDEGGEPAEPSTTVDGSAVAMTVDGDEALAEVDEGFVSVGLDMAQIVGGRFWNPEGGVAPEASTGGGAAVDPYDLSRTRLRALFEPFGTTWLRIGGTAADGTYVDLSDSPSAEPPAGYDYVLTRERWDEVAQFAEELGWELTITLNGGPGPRGGEGTGAWTPDQARSLVEHAVEQDQPVGVWALGNEPNYYIPNYGGPDATQFASDYRRFADLIRELDPDALVAGPSSAFWPEAGEFFPTIEPFLAGAGDAVDIVTWHYYPQQSDRCITAVVPASPERALEPSFLDEIGEPADVVEAARDVSAPGAPVWLQETGNAQCGGQVGLSDRFVAGFWWLDQLGTLARRGQQVVVRWNLSGADYGLVREPDLDPNPDYWSSLLWKQLMGEVVLSAAVDDQPTLRTYAHCSAGGPSGSVTTLVENLDEDAPQRIRFDGVDATDAQVYLLTAPDLLGREVDLNGERLVVDADGAPPALEGRPISGALELPPASYAFVVLPRADAEACT